MGIRKATVSDARHIKKLFCLITHFNLNPNVIESPQWFNDKLSRSLFADRLRNSQYQIYLYEYSGTVVEYIAKRS